MLDINESLGETIDLISPTRELIKEGKILRVAARDGGRYERYMFLVSCATCVEFFLVSLTLWPTYRTQGCSETCLLFILLLCTVWLYLVLYLV